MRPATFMIAAVLAMGATAAVAAGSEKGRLRTHMLPQVPTSAKSLVSLDCGALPTGPRTIAATLDQLATGVLLEVASKGLCRLSIHAPGTALIMADTRYRLALLGPRDEVVDAASFGGNTDRVEGTILIPIGKHQLRLGLDYNIYPAPKVPSSELGKVFAFSLSGVDDVSDYRVRDIRAWIRAADLQDKIDVLGVCRVEHFRGDLCDDMARVAVRIGISRNPKNEVLPEDKYEPSKAALESVARLSEAQLTERAFPTYILVLRPLGTREEFSAVTRAFRITNGVDLWDVLLAKLSAAYNAPTKSFVISANTSCAETYVFRRSPGINGSGGMWCMSSSAAAPLPALKAGAAGVRTTKLIGVASIAPNVKQLLASEFGSSANVTFLEETTTYVELVVRRIRGVVIQGGTSWEKLHLNFLLDGAAGQLRVIGDDRIAAGIGGYPPDSQFTQDVEPQYTDQLSQYIKCIATVAASVRGTKPLRKCHQ